MPKKAKKAKAKKVSFMAKGKKVSFTAKKQRGGCKCKHEGQEGAGFFGDVGDFFTKTIPRTAVKVHDFVKKNKLVSRGLGLIPHPYAKAGGTAAGMLGYGMQHGGASARIDPVHRMIKGQKMIKF